MKKYYSKIAFLVLISLLASCAQKPATVKSVMDRVITNLYETKSQQELNKLDNEQILQLFSQQERQVLATKYWCFDVNVPVVVSVLRHEGQKIVPFWLKESRFVKTGLTANNEHDTYEVWQKKFDAGRVELGINGFDKHRPHYFVSVGPKDKNALLKLSNFFPKNQHVATMDEGAFTYHDWDELVLLEVPEELKGQKLLTTIRGRAREAHLIQAFRSTPYPSSQKPDQIMLTWSDDPATTQSIQWRTSADVNNGQVLFWEKGSDQKKPFEIEATCSLLEDRLLQNDRYIHRFTATLTGLAPETTFAYKVGNPVKNIWSDEAEFKTAPERQKPFSFVYFGDTHRSPHWGKLLQSANNRHPNTACYTIAGDVVSTGLYRDDWDQLFQYSGNVFNNKPLMPAIGNHDDQDGLGAWMFCELFDLPQNGPQGIEPEMSYSFEYGNAFFLVIAATLPIEKQTAWIEEQLACTKAKWKFAIFHFPPYSYEEDYPVIRKQWGDVFDNHHVDFVMSGHVHYYMRSKPMFNQKPVKSPANGTIYLISIAVPNRDQEMPKREWVQKRFGGEMLYQTFDINGDELVYRALNIDGQVRDELKIKK